MMLDRERNSSVTNAHYSFIFLPLKSSEKETSKKLVIHSVGEDISDD